MTVPSVLLAAVLAAACATHALAQPAGDAAKDLAAIRAALGADKRAYVAGQLALTDAEAKRFWPIYDAHQRQLATTVRRDARLIEEIVALDQPVSDAYAKRLANELVAIDEEEAKDQHEKRGPKPPSKSCAASLTRTCS